MPTVHTVALLWVATTCAFAAEKETPNAVMVDASATVHMPPTAVPFSSLASAEAKAAFLADQEYVNKNGWMEKFFGPKQRPIAEQRAILAARFQPALDRVKTLYATQTVPWTVAGVRTEVVTPKEGVAARNKKRVLINLHGGGFVWGAGLMSMLESMPVASLGKIKVVTVDYRQGPEHQFPAASEDVATVYRELLKEYEPENIGIYGCSAGGLLTAEAIVWIAHEKLPRPGAIGIFCASASGWSGGDSGYLALPLNGLPAPTDLVASDHPEVSNASYFKDADFDSPLVMPIRSAATLAKFPPTLVLSATRDLAMSSAVHTHLQLTKLGVPSELYVWEGLGHGFFTTSPDLPETREAWDRVTEFFDNHLGVD
jgi:acetyl esterase/lipase